MLKTSVTTFVAGRNGGKEFYLFAEKLVSQVSWMSVELSVPASTENPLLCFNIVAWSATLLRNFFVFVRDRNCTLPLRMSQTEYERDEGRWPSGRMFEYVSHNPSCRNVSLLPVFFTYVPHWKNGFLPPPDRLPAFATINWGTVIHSMVFWRVSKGQAYLWNVF